MNALLAHGGVPCFMEGEMILFLLGAMSAGALILKTKWAAMKRQFNFWLIAHHINHVCDHTCHCWRYTPFTAR